MKRKNVWIVLLFLLLLTGCAGESEENPAEERIVVGISQIGA